MLRKSFLALLLAVSCTAQSLDLYDEEIPWTPLKKEHALFYATLWGTISAGFVYGIYELGKTLQEPITSDAFMNDLICLIMMGMCAKVAHHSAGEAIDGLNLYFEDDAQQAKEANS